MKINVRLLLAMSFVLFTIGSVWAQPENMRRGYNKERSGGHMSYLNLSEDQQSEIKNLRMEHTKSRMIYKNQMNEKKAVLKTQVTQDQPDLVKINQLIEEIGELNTALEKSRISQRLKVRALLDEEQKLAFDTRKPTKGKHEYGHRKGRGNRW